MGNAQQVADGGVFVGWGTFPGFSEIGPDGHLRFDARFVGTSVTYRARRDPWVGRPLTRPAIATGASAGGTTLVYASWNGATEVARWQVRAGLERDRPAAAAHRHPPGVRDVDHAARKDPLRRRRGPRPEGCRARRIATDSGLSRPDPPAVARRPSLGQLSLTVAGGTWPLDPASTPDSCPGLRSPTIGDAAAINERRDRP